MDVLKRVPVREQDPKVRATNFEEVCLGYNQEEAQEEATRCLNCKNAQCVKGCPVSKTQQQLSLSPVHCQQSADVFVHRRASVKENVSAALRAILFPSVNWSVS